LRPLRSLGAVEDTCMVTTSDVSHLRTPRGDGSPPEILLVEDNPAEIYLLRKGFDTGPLLVSLHNVPSVSEALAFLHQAEPYHQAPLPQLIVTSINLAGQKSGFELIAKVKQDPALRVIPVIVFSTYTEPAIIQQSYALGANSYITKPYKLDAYLRAIHTIVEYCFTGPIPGDPEALPQALDTPSKRVCSNGSE
jgi:chemotaxis family two-component system response regulator Rcp1